MDRLDILDGLDWVNEMFHEIDGCHGWDGHFIQIAVQRYSNDDRNDKDEWWALKEHLIIALIRVRPTPAPYIKAVLKWHEKCFKKIDSDFWFFPTAQGIHVMGSRRAAMRPLLLVLKVLAWHLREFPKGRSPKQKLSWQPIPWHAGLFKTIGVCQFHDKDLAFWVAAKPLETAQHQHVTVPQEPTIRMVKNSSWWYLLTLDKSIMMTVWHDSWWQVTMLQIDTMFASWNGWISKRPTGDLMVFLGICWSPWPTNGSPPRTPWSLFPSETLRWYSKGLHRLYDHPSKTQLSQWYPRFK